MSAMLRKFVSAGNVWIAAGLIACTSLAVGRIHLRVQTTLIGYEIGRLKTEESKLLEDRATLRMQLAKLTTKKHLQMMTEAGSEAEPDQETMASK